ncbi:E3 ubiquitin-protein ligase TRIM39 isoform X2 [Electrophorus electricus]|uniref:E3 ubiquitin-protein ligase TRIM39 isoform X2 n=1 Tax=Electrophorus electricus TaxID=8005 RepID=UPI0015D06E62|nr:E3 ubiquitin-protein ligase TRIM39 isoform X2 [Electrophorus electricus]
MMAPCQDALTKQQESLKKHRNFLAYRMNKLSAKKMDLSKTAALKEKIKMKYDDIKRVLDEDLGITLCQLDMEEEAMERTIEENIERCYHLTQDLDQQLAEISIQLDMKISHDQVSETEGRIMETLTTTDPELVQMDEVKNEQLLSLTMNLLLFIRSQVPVTKKLFQTYAQEVVLNPDSAHPKLIISPAGDCATYTDTWQEVAENPSRFDTILNVISQEGFKEGRNYWEVQVSGKTYWEVGLTYPNIPRKGHEEDCWLGRGPESWCVEYFNGDYTAWHKGVPYRLSHVTGKNFERIGIFSTFYGGLLCFLGADTMTPLFSFCAGMFTDTLHQAVCPGHDNQGTNWKSLLICDASRSAPIL